MRRARPAVIVEKGDTLSAIAERELGRASGWKLIAKLNPRLRDNPHLIHPGDIIALPATLDREEWLDRA